MDITSAPSGSPASAASRSTLVVPPQYLGHYHPGVTTCSHQGTVGHGRAHRFHTGVDASSSSITAFMVKGHVGAGVAVGHRIHVEIIDPVAVVVQRIVESVQDTTEGRFIQRVQTAGCV